VVAVPLRIFQGLLFGCILYWAAGLNPAASAFFVFCCLIICMVGGQGAGRVLRWQGAELEGAELASVC